MLLPAWTPVRAARYGTVLFLLCLLAPRSAEGSEPVQARLTAIAFASDHKLLCRNSTDIRSPGTPYPADVWNRNPPPFTCTGGSQHLRANLILTIAGAGEGTLYQLQGTSDEPAFCFNSEGELPDWTEFMVDMEAIRPLTQHIRKIQRSIRWTLTLRPPNELPIVIGLGITGPHVAYVTLGTPHVTTEDPRTLPTDIRMELAINRAGAAQAKAGVGVPGPWLVYELMAQNGTHYLPTRHYGRDLAWKLPETWEMEPKGASCISIVEFVNLVCNMVGVDGDPHIAAFYARPPDVRKAVYGGLGDPPITKKSPSGENWQLFLVDDSNSRKGQVGGVGGMNFYEAVLEYDWRGKKYFYPGGTNRVYDNPDHVISIFRTLAWAAWEEWRQEWVVREVVTTYSVPGDKQIHSCYLPRKDGSE